MINKLALFEKPLTKINANISRNKTRYMEAKKYKIKLFGDINKTSIVKYYNDLLKC